MQFSSLHLQTAVSALAASGDEVMCAYRENFLLEENIGALRSEDYAACIKEISDEAPLTAQHESQYLAQRVQLASRESVADTFLPINAQAQFDTLEGNQLLIRLEKLDRPLKRADDDCNTVEKLQSLLSLSQDSAASNPLKALNALDRFVAQWNESNDARPMFAAFKRQLETEIDSDDWMHLIRDRLGLAHLQPGLAGKPTVVALMCYTVSEIENRKKTLQKKQTASDVGIAPFSRPTVLDFEFNAFFVPAAKGANYGATLDLAPTQKRAQCSEILHLPINYQSKHILKIGTITRHYALGMGLNEARRRHREAQSVA
ncbi:MAG: hypothetical protein QM533_03655 [Cytophagales bacterium]|nr:hypothetical protein [Cytophagales bacterium]